MTLRGICRAFEEGSNSGRQKVFSYCVISPPLPLLPCQGLKPLWSTTIPKFYGVSDTAGNEDGVSFVVMQRVKGVTLAIMPRVPFYVGQAARRSLSRLHKAGVAHGDVRCAKS